MNRRLVFTLILVLFIVVSSVVVFSILANDTAGETSANSNESFIYNRMDDKIILQSFDLNKFYKSLPDAVSQDYSKLNIRGGVVNHHLLADQLIAEFFAIIALNEPDIVILVGPNHSGEGLESIHTSVWDYSTPFGDLRINRELINYLIKEEQVGYNYQLAEVEHSMNALIPYIKYYLPNVELVPVILSSAVDINKVSMIAERLSDKVKDQKVLVVASIDFSHYLPLEEADQKDIITKELMLNRDYNRLRLLNDDYLDSPASAVFLLRMVEHLGSNAQSVINQGNSARIYPSEYNNTTSYMTIIYF